MTRHFLCALLLLAPLPRFAAEPAPAAVEGKDSLTREEALALAFPKCDIERKTILLDPAQKKRVALLAKTEFEVGVVYAYEARSDRKLVGTAYFDAHRVRTIKETLMVVVAPDGRVLRVEVLSFSEPPEYLPRANFYAQFKDKPLDDELELKRGIRTVAGATLTARATTNAVRRVLAVHAVLTTGSSALAPATRAVESSRS